MEGFLISGIALCLFGSYAYLAPPPLKLQDQVSLDTYLETPFQLERQTFSGYHETKNITLGKLEVGDFVWIRVYPTTPFFYYGIEWEKGDTEPIGYIEDKGANLEIARVNGLWFYRYTPRYGYPPFVVGQVTVWPYAWAFLKLLTENERIVDEKDTAWNYSSVEVDAPRGDSLEIQYKVDRNSPIGVNYIVRFEGSSGLPFWASISVEVYSFLLHDYAWLPLTTGLALLVASIFSNRAQRRRRPSVASQGSLDNKRLRAKGDRWR